MGQNVQRPAAHGHFAASQPFKSLLHVAGTRHSVLSIPLLTSVQRLCIDLQPQQFQIDEQLYLVIIEVAEKGDVHDPKLRPPAPGDGNQAIGEILFADCLGFTARRTLAHESWSGPRGSNRPGTVLPGGLEHGKQVGHAQQVADFL